MVFGAKIYTGLSATIDTGNLSLTYCHKEHETGFQRKSFWSTFISSSIDLGSEKSFKQVSAME